MSLDLVTEVWDVLRSHIDFNERGDAADTLVNFLIDNNYEAEDIKDAFRGDKEIITAVKDYLSQHEDELEYEDEDYYGDSDDDEWD
jgi:homoserine dehydrogenase